MITDERRAEIERELAAMEQAEVAVYHAALRVEAHEFQVFAALMSAYRDLARAALDQGLDYVMEGSLAKAPPRKMLYIGQKFGRLFGPWLAQREHAVEFLKGVHGYELTDPLPPEVEGKVEPPESPTSISCPLCGRTSHHPKDVEQRFCSVCGFHDDIALETARLARAAFPKRKVSVVSGSRHILIGADDVKIAEFHGARAHAQAREWLGTVVR
jgi:ribosomal protein L37E